MKKEDKKFLSIWIILILNFILMIIAFYNFLRYKLTFLSCSQILCLDHILFGLLAPIGLYFLGVIALFCYYKYIRLIEKKSIGDYLLKTRFNRLSSWVIYLVGLFGFEIYYQFYAYPNESSLKQFINSLVAIPLILPYIFWFRKNESNQNQHIKKYKKIVDILIKKSFPILRTKKIEISENKDLNFSADAFKLFSYFKIRTHPRLKNYNKNKLIAIFAHELSHLEFWQSMNWFNYYFIRDFNRLSKKYKKFEEEIADKKVIMLSYAHELFSQRKSRWNDKNPKVIKNKWMYMGPDEIKEYAKSINKW